MMSIVTSELEEDDECRLLSSFTDVNKNKKKMMTSKTVAHCHYFFWKIIKTTTSNSVTRCHYLVLA
jgi:hypothetical protein